MRYCVVIWGWVRQVRARQVWCVPLRYGESCCVEVRYGEAGLVSHGRVCSGMLGSVNVGQV